MGWLTTLQSAAVTLSALLAVGTALFRPLRKRLRGTEERLMEALDALSEKVDANERDRLRQELFRYGNLARRGAKISGEEFRYLQECFEKYTRLGGNGIAHDEYELVRAYYDREGWK